MTGLDPKKCKIIEVGIIITDINFNELETYEAIIKQPKRVLGASDEWVKENMKVLLHKSETEGLDEDEVLEDIEDLIQRHFGKNMAVLAGNSIHQDRRFVRKYWPAIEKKLHYRMLDVSAWKVLMTPRFGTSFTKREEHRALEDIRGSIEEMQSYIDFFEGKS